MEQDYYDGKEIDEIDRVAFAELDQIADSTENFSTLKAHKAPPVKVDLSQYLHYIRKQGPHGCWGYSFLAVWDIMNEMACPFTPNLSMNLWLREHRRRFDWEIKAIDEETGSLTDRIVQGLPSPDGRFHHKNEKEPHWFLRNFGIPTEGTELTNYSSTIWVGTMGLRTKSVQQGLAKEFRVCASGGTIEGINEAENYKLKSEPIKIPVNSSEFMLRLANGYPIRVSVKNWNHYVAIVGYDFTQKKFTYVNSSGDCWGRDGFGTFSFQDVDDPHTPPIINVAECLEIIPPNPVPAARIAFTHTNRMNVDLWLSIEDSPIPKKKIWPPAQTHDFEKSRDEGRWFPWDDNSRNLCYTVRLPSETDWPPSSHNRLVLDLYDSGAYSESGGNLVEFTAAFGGHVITCADLSQGPVKFDSRTHHRFCIP